MADDGTMRRIWRYKSDLEQEPDEEKLLEILGKLKRLSVSISALQETGIGKVVNSLRKRTGAVGELARRVVTSWKCVVEREVTTSKNRSPSPGDGSFSAEVKYEHKSGDESDADSWNSFNEEDTDERSCRSRHKADSQCTKKRKYLMDSAGTVKEESMCPVISKQAKDSSVGLGNVKPEPASDYIPAQKKKYGSENRDEMKYEISSKPDGVMKVTSQTMSLKSEGIQHSSHHGGHHFRGLEDTDHSSSHSHSIDGKGDRHRGARVVDRKQRQHNISSSEDDEEQSFESSHSNQTDCDPSPYSYKPSSSSSHKPSSSSSSHKPSSSSSHKLSSSSSHKPSSSSSSHKPSSSSSHKPSSSSSSHKPSSSSSSHKPSSSSSSHRPSSSSSSHRPSSSKSSSNGASEAMQDNEGSPPGVQQRSTPDALSLSTGKASSSHRHDSDAAQVKAGSSYAQVDDNTPPFENSSSKSEGSSQKDPQSGHSKRSASSDKTGLSYRKDADQAFLSSEKRHSSSSKDMSSSSSHSKVSSHKRTDSSDKPSSSHSKESSHKRTDSSDKPSTSHSKESSHKRTDSSDKPSPSHSKESSHKRANSSDKCSPSNKHSGKMKLHSKSTSSNHKTDTSSPVLSSEQSCFRVSSSTVHINEHLPHTKNHDISPSASLPSNKTPGAKDTKGKSSTLGHKKSKSKSCFEEPELDLFSEAIHIKAEPSSPPVHRPKSLKPITTKPGQALPAISPMQETLSNYVPADVTVKSEFPVKVKSEFPVTVKSEFPVTVKSEFPVTVKSEFPVTVKSDFQSSIDEPTPGHSFMDIVKQEKACDSDPVSKPKKGKHKTHKSAQEKEAQIQDENNMSFEDFMTFDGTALATKGKSSRQSSSKSSSSSASKASHKPAGSKWASSLTDSPVSSKTIFSVPAPPSNVTELDILSMLPETHASYKPLRFNPYFMDGQEKEPSPPPLVDPDIIGTKSGSRTHVYSGRKHFITEVKSLYDLCMQVLIDNIDAIDCVGSIPYSILKPVLERCSAQQLYQLEDYNPHFLEDTGELWQILSQRDFKGSKPQELENWRELYMRRFEERELKYQRLKQSMSSNISKGQAGRKAQLAYVDTVAKPPREVLRKQKQFGTGCVARSKTSPAMAGSSSGLRTYKPSMLVPAYNPMDDRPRLARPMPPMMAKSMQMRKNMRR